MKLCLFFDPDTGYWQHRRPSWIQRLKAWIGCLIPAGPWRPRVQE